MIYVGSARLDERNDITGGQAGDQKQKSTPDYSGEVAMEPMYNHPKGWYILRPKSTEHADKIAEAMIRACNNPNIGYDQLGRAGVVKYGTASTIKTEADCSSLVRTCVIEATGKDPGNFYTANEADILESTGLFNKRVSYVSQAVTPVYNGDILVTRTKYHTVVVVSGSPRTIPAANQTTKLTWKISQKYKNPAYGVAKKETVVHTYPATSSSALKKWPKLGKGNEVDVIAIYENNRGEHLYKVRIANQFNGFVGMTTLTVKER